MNIKDMMDMMLGKSDKYIECDQCHGYGSSLEESSAKCTKCHGEGIILK